MRILSLSSQGPDFHPIGCISGIWAHPWNDVSSPDQKEVIIILQPHPQIKGNWGHFWGWQDLEGSRYLDSGSQQSPRGPETMHHKPLNWDENCQWALLACETKIRDCPYIRAHKFRKKKTLYPLYSWETRKRSPWVSSPKISGNSLDW